MAGTGFLRTVNFGGFDKKDVLSYVDELNSKIYNLENDLNEKIQLLEEGDGSQKIEGAEKYEEMLAESKAKIGELMGNVDTLKLEISNLENELSEKNADITKLKEERVMLEEKLESAKSGTSTITEASFDIGSVFIEAKHSADRIITEAKNAAKKIEDDSRTLSQQIIDDANFRAEGIISSSQENYEKTMSEAKKEAANIIESTNRTKKSIVANYDLVATDIEKLANCLNDIVSDGVLKLVDAKRLIEERKSLDFINNDASKNENLEVEKKNNYIIENDVENDVTLTYEDETEETQDAEIDNSENVANKNLNIDLDLLAGLTAEIETSYNSTYNETNLD